MLLEEPMTPNMFEVKRCPEKFYNFTTYKSILANLSKFTWAILEVILAIKKKWELDINIDKPKKKKRLIHI